MPRGATISEIDPGSGALCFLLRRAHPAGLARVGLLMTAVSVSEGLGLFLLVPLVAAISGGALPAPFARFAGSTGLQPGGATLLAGFVVLVTLRALAQYALSLQALRLGTAVVDGLRGRCTELLLGAPWRRLAAMRQSDNASLLIANIDRVDAGLRSLTGAAAAAVTLAGAACAALAISPTMALIGALGGLLVVLAYRGLRRRARLLGEELGRANDAVYARIDQTLGALRLIKTSLAEQRAADAVAQGFGALRSAELAWLRSFGRGQLALQVAAAAALALMVWLATNRLDLGAPVILPLVALLARTVPLLGSLQENWQNWLHARPALEETARLIAVLEPELEAPLPAGSARRAWRGAVAYVQQDPVLFHASIAENLVFARPGASEEDMQAALAAASADFVAGLPQGLATIVGDRGTRLSGGERQRLSLARALLAQPQLLILDEATSALDAANEAAIAAALRGLKGQLTIVVICHRGALTELADRIVTLDEGRLTSDLLQ